MFNKAKPSLEQVTKNVPVLLMHSGETRVALQIDDLSANREVLIQRASPHLSADRLMLLAPAV
jgi:chemotaxis protein histidine kinase CheA